MTEGKSTIDALRARIHRIEPAREHIDSLNVQIDKLLTELAPLVKSRDEWRKSLEDGEQAMEELRALKTSTAN